jgi:redox-sensitive bicupin YhaK (pirin superfamily)
MNLLSMRLYLIFMSICFTLITSCEAQGNKHIKNGDSISTTLSDKQYVIHRAGTRGETKEDWLLSKHTFSFNNYHDRNRVGFGALLVLNDDWVKAGAGFGMHHHEEMEIISIPLSGGVAHKDSKGSSGITSVNKEEGHYTVQQMTAGSGISHSELNASKTDSVRFLQIWISPNKQNLTPTYNQRQFAFSNQHNKWQTLIAPKDSGAIHINQEAVFSIADIDAGKKLQYSLKYNGGLYAFVLEGKVEVSGIELHRRDGIGIVDIKQLSVVAKENVKVLLIEVPVK